MKQYCWVGYKEARAAYNLGQTVALCSKNQTFESANCVAYIQKETHGNFDRVVNEYSYCYTHEPSSFYIKKEIPSQPEHVYWGLI